MSSIQYPPILIYSVADKILVNMENVLTIKDQGDHPLFNFGPSSTETFSCDWDSFVMKVRNQVGRHPNHKFVILI